MSTAKPSPVIDDINRPFWEAVEADRLLLQSCSGCGLVRYPINAICPNCLNDEYLWTEMSGEGEVFSTIVFHQVYHQAYRSEVPYNVSIVQLKEGPRLITNVVDVDPDKVAVGDRVRVVFRSRDDGVKLPQFVRDEV